MKIDLTAIANVLRQHIKDEDVIRDVLADLHETAEPATSAKPEGDAGPAPKKKFVVVLLDQKKLDLSETLAWVVQIPEESPDASALVKLRNAISDYNTTRKGRKFPVKTNGEAFEIIRGKAATNNHLWIKTRTAAGIAVLTTNVVES